MASPEPLVQIQNDFTKLFLMLHSTKLSLQSLNNAFNIANNADPDEMQQPTKLLFHGFPVCKVVFIPHFQIVPSSNAPGAKNIKKIYLSETTRPRASILCL